MRKVIATECAPGVIRPYVQDVDLSSMVLTSGQAPVYLQTDEVAENVVDQTHQSLENVRTIVESAGLKVSDIVKTTVFISDLNDFATINQVHQQFFDGHKTIYPMRSCMQVARLPESVELEVEVIAICGDTL